MMPDDSVERWRPVPGYELHYSVSNLGRVSRIKAPIRTNAGVLKGTRGSHGYRAVKLSRRSKERSFTVHSLVAAAFLGERPFPDAEVNHKNGNKLDNRAANLEWVTRARNAQHARDEGLWTAVRGEATGRHKLTDADVLFIRAQDPRVTNKTLALRFGVSATTIRSARRGLGWAHIPVAAPPAPHYVGETQRQARLTDADVRLIRSSTLGMTTLARRLGVSKSTVWRVRHGMNWSHVI